ncbi:MAG: histidine kinase N-terminal 7TM domain-containing diguanylate cyclase [Chloroflexota bacterium]|nr:diguanylate cyclase [Chloroflexota bacterium]MBI5703219.1 diguanylate cyclase [Chloroflexota bacterium]
MFQLHPYSVVLALSTIATLSVLIIAWRRTAPGAFALKIMLAGMFIWSGAYAMVWLSASLPQKIFWLKVTYFGVVIVPTCFLLFTLFLTRREKWLTFRNLLLLAIEPVLIVLMVWLSPQALFASIRSFTQDGYVIMNVQRGAGFWFNLFYSYLLILLGLALLTVSYRQANSFFKRQYRMILLGSVVPFLFSAFTHLRREGSIEPDYTPMMFGITGVVYVYAIFRHKFMDLVPFARSHLIEKMSDGLVVVDVEGRIVDINPAMKNFLDADPVSFLGKNITDILNIWNDRFEHLMQGQEIRTEMRLPHKPSRYLDLRVTPLYDNDHTLNGRIIVFRDITDRKEVEKDLRHAMDRMQTQLIEIGLLQSQLREQAIRDALTNLFNRRYLEETLERELARAAREVYPLCIVMMDIDHFKEVNDTYGHEAGDIVLKTLAETVTSQSRHGDFVCRYGGEEFVLVMPNISLEVAKERVSSLHRSISLLYIPFGRFSLNVTVSMGLSAFPLHGEKKEDLLRAADRALYAAKHAGRNRVAVYRENENGEEKEY